MPEDDAYVGKWVRPASCDPIEMVGRKAFHDLDWLADYIAELIELKPQHDVLDLCCGNGLITSRLARKVARITGVDYSAALLKQANEISAASNIVYREGNALALDEAIGGQRFDRIYCLSAFQYFNDEMARAVLKELRARINPDGRIAILEVPDKGRKSSHMLKVLMRAIVPANQAPSGAVHTDPRPVWSRLAAAARGAATLLRFGRKPDALGWWWSRTEFSDCARSCGFDCEVLDEPQRNPLHTYRFDAVLRPR